MNNKGFTLVELLMVIVLLSVIILVATPIVGNSLNNSKEASYKILLSNIVTGSKEYFEECSYNKEAITDINKCNIVNNTLQTDLNTLVSLGYLSASNECEEEGETNKCSAVIKNPKDKQNIGNCQIIIIKNKDSNGKITYTINGIGTESSCPTGELGSAN